MKDPDDEWVDEDSDKEYKCFNISSTLRELARMVEEGEIDPIGCVVVFSNIEEVTVHGLGEMVDAEAAYGLLEAALEELTEEDE